jgi:hypothetical protein
VLRIMGVCLSYSRAIECLYYACQNSQERSLYKLELLIDWLCRYIPTMRSVDYLKEIKSKESLSPEHKDNLFFLQRPIEN